VVPPEAAIIEGSLKVGFFYDGDFGHNLVSDPCNPKTQQGGLPLYAGNGALHVGLRTLPVGNREFRSNFQPIRFFMETVELSGNYFISSFHRTNHAIPDFPECPLFAFP
jgi:hypothetical protein